MSGYIQSSTRPGLHVALVGPAKILVSQNAIYLKNWCHIEAKEFLKFPIGAKVVLDEAFELLWIEGKVPVRLFSCDKIEVKSGGDPVQWLRKVGVKHLVIDHGRLLHLFISARRWEGRGERDCPSPHFSSAQWRQRLGRTEWATPTFFIPDSVFAECGRRYM